METNVIVDDRLLGKSHTDRLLQPPAEPGKDLNEQMLEVFKERVRLNRQGQYGDVVRGC